ncbi:hypothetical protein ACIBEF_31410 [Micromonospora sp. NPDC050795]|uniref:hypothetical protein n=1 Tax=Micromonospora sp. NPDC050795 TaxID=3364282 RepID=UPI00378F66FF
MRASASKLSRSARVSARGADSEGIDVLIDNAGHMLSGAVEEVSSEQARAVLPGMRRRR